MLALVVGIADIAIGVHVGVEEGGAIGESEIDFSVRSGRDLGKAAIGAVDEDLVEIPVAIDVRRADPLPFSRRALLKPDCPGGTGSGWQLLSQHIRLQFSSACGGDAMAGIRY